MTLQRQQTPIIYSPQDFEYLLPQISVEKLDNGIPFYSLTDAIEPVLQLELVFDAGLWFESKNAISQAVAPLLKSGTSRLTSYQINDTFEQYGASVKVSNGPDWSSVTISCLTKHLGAILPLVYELLTDTQFPQSEIDIYVQNAKQRLSVQLLKSEFIANRKIDEYLFGFKHPYGKYLFAEDYDAIHRDDLLSHVKNFYTSANCKMFMAGMFSEEDKKMINQYFGSGHWNHQGAQASLQYNVEPEKEKKHRIIHDEKSVQGSIRMARPFPMKTHPDFVPMIMLNTLFGGYFGSRLMSNIREDKGYTYGIHSMLLNQKYDSAFIITTEAGKDVCELAIKEIYKEMALLQHELVNDEELDLVKNYLLGSILGGLDGSFHIIQRWKSLILNGFTEQRFYNNIEIYKTITPAKIQTLAQQYLNEADFYELIVT